jgi:hypothetical protein
MFINVDALPLWYIKETLNALFHGTQGLLRQEGRVYAEVNDTLVEGSAGDRTNRTESYVCFQVFLTNKFMNKAMHKTGHRTRYTVFQENSIRILVFNDGAY